MPFQADFLPFEGNSSDLINPELGISRDVDSKLHQDFITSFPCAQEEYAERFRFGWDWPIPWNVESGLFKRDWIRYIHRGRVRELN